MRCKTGTKCCVFSDWRYRDRRLALSPPAIGVLYNREQYHLFSINAHDLFSWAWCVTKSQHKNPSFVKFIFTLYSSLSSLIFFPNNIFYVFSSSANYRKISTIQIKENRVILLYFSRLIVSLRPQLLDTHARKYKRKPSFSFVLLSLNRIFGAEHRR